MFHDIPKSLNSHVRGWSELWSKQLNTRITNDINEIENARLIYLDPGVNYSGTLNVFGGINDKIVNKMKACIKSEVRLIWLSEISPPENLKEGLIKRIGKPSTSKDLTEYLIEEFCKLLNAKYDQNEYMFDTGEVEIVFGDSHATAFSYISNVTNRPVPVFRNNGLTLRRVVKDDLITKKVGNHIEKITISLGNIDIRHHICRDNYDWVFKSLEEQLIKISDKGVKIDFSIPWPIEHEGRKIPKTGYFDGTPFYGSWTQRVEQRNVFVWNLINIKNKCKGMNLIGLNDKVVHDSIEDPERYAKNYMEGRSSVHLSPEKYYWKDKSEWSVK